MSPDPIFLDLSSARANQKTRFGGDPFPKVVSAPRCDPASNVLVASVL